ncbi:threonine/serine exporter family protein, partial [Enterococcus faecalis]|uniref:threonine/serine exporter family protein n=1 Tax=Enterococcus faecalis TaxID=1351 RepID=UPI003CC5F51E
MKGAIPLVNSVKRKQLIFDTCILAGKIMLESGSEVFRTEDTITRIAANAGEPVSVCYTTARGFFVG